MPALDPKEEAICQAYVACGGNQSEAWRATHPNSKAKPKTQHEEASKFFRQPKVRTRILELQLEVAQASTRATAFTRDAHDAELVKLREMAKEQGKISAAIAAEVKRGELHGFYVKRSEHGAAGEFDNMTTEELEAYLN